MEAQGKMTHVWQYAVLNKKKRTFNETAPLNHL